MSDEPIERMSFRERIAHHAAVAAENHLRMVDAATALGVPVFPCAADKRPLTKNGYKDASANPTAIDAMPWGAAVMIGMPTGAMSGLVAIDVDIHGDVDGTPWLTANAASLPPTQKNRTKSGGLHLIFQVPSVEIRNSASRLAPGVDVRGEGGYIIVPPSPGYQVADTTPPAAMPEWLITACQPTEAPPRPSYTNGHAKAASSDPWPDARIEGLLRPTMDALRSAPDGAKHATLVSKSRWIGGIMDQIGLGEEDAVRRIIGALPATVRDWAAAEKTARWGLAAGRAAPVELEEERGYTPASGPHPAEALIDRLRGKPRQASAARPVAPELMDCPGVLGEFVAHCVATAISPQPFLALAAGICLVGALAGRKYASRTNLRTNVYAVGIADSGGGKDHARQQIKACLAGAGLTRYLAGEDVTSGQAIMTTLERHPVALFQIDEFGNWLSGVLGKRAPTHKAQIAERLKSLYSSAGTLMLGTEYANQSAANGKPRADIHQPHVIIHGTTTPGQFWRSLDGGAVDDGLLPRILLFVSPEDHPDEADPKFSAPPAALLDSLKSIVAGVTGHNGGNLGDAMLASTAAVPYVVPETPDAVTTIKAMRQNQLTALRGTQEAFTAAILARWAENAIKLALIRAVSRNPAAPVITEDDVAWGRALARHCLDAMAEGAGQYIAESEYEGRLNKALHIIRKYGPLTESKMIRQHGFRHSARERADLIQTLIAGGLIQVKEVRHEGAGRPTTLYAAIH